MKFVPVDRIPKKRASRHNLQDFIKEFANSNAKFVRIDLSEHDYKSYMVCASCMHAAVKRSMLPIKVSVRDGNVYLSKLYPKRIES